MVKLHGKIWEGIKVRGYFSTGIRNKVWERILGDTESMGRNEGMAELMMKTWEGTTQNRNLPNEKNWVFL